LTPEDGPDSLSRNVGKQLQRKLHNIPRQRWPEGTIRVLHWSQFVYKPREVHTLLSLCSYSTSPTRPRVDQHTAT